MPEKTEVLFARVSPSFARKVDAEAERLGHTRSSFIRYVLRQWCDADAVTLERARLVDPGVAYETEEE
jgi:hypothetical protein